MTKYIIIDDEPIAHDIITGYCDLLSGMELQKNCYDAIEALEYLKVNTVDLIFLDLNMPKLKGFDFLKTLTSPPQVIVTTAYREFAIEGYELNIVDYLLKPFSFERFLKALNKASIAKGEQPTNNSTEEERPSESIFLRSNKKYVQVLVTDILYLESAGNYVKVITLKEQIIVRDKISMLLLKLPIKDFVKVHKSFAVAKIHVSSIEGNRIFINEHQVPIGKLYKSEVNTWLI